MRILIAGAHGTVGKAAAAELGKRHTIITLGRSKGDFTADLMKPESIEAMFAKAGTFDAIVSCTGHTYFGPLATMTTAQFMGGINDKLMGQVNLVLAGLKHIADGGSFTLTSGVLDRDPIRQGVNAAAVNGAIDAFVFAAAIDLPRALRINAVSPGLLEESAKKYEGFFPGHQPVSSARVGVAYAKSVEGALTGKVITVD
jgi:NAD(P)-dependent dehydrogenase (short-subunit alcohol dehydrogenase family)